MIELMLHLDTITSITVWRNPTPKKGVQGVLTTLNLS